VLSEPVDPNEPNPYQAPLAPPGEVVVSEEQRRGVNYPGGLRTVALIAASCGFVVGLMFAAPFRQAGAFVLVFVLLLWAGSFATLSLLLPGSAAVKTARTFVSILLAGPALILYVPVCGFVFVGIQVTTSSGEVGMILGSVAAFTVTVLIAALLIRRSARITYRPELTADLAPLSDPDAAEGMSNNE
jgi:hypothetical protein